MPPRCLKIHRINYAANVVETSHDEKMAINAVRAHNLISMQLDTVYDHFDANFICHEVQNRYFSIKNAAFSIKKKHRNFMCVPFFLSLRNSIVKMFAVFSAPNGI